MGKQFRRFIFVLGATCTAVAATVRAEEEESVTVYNIVEPSVVLIENLGVLGTGILLDKNGMILTNAHVACSPLPFHCQAEVLKAGKREIVTFSHVEIVGFHPSLDLALMRISAREGGGAFEPAHIARYKGKPAQQVYVIGNPGGAGDEVLTKTFTSGNMSAVDRMRDGAAHYQISAAINPGNSGGPVCDKYGKVLGVVTAKDTERDGIGYAIPAFDLKFEEFVSLGKRQPNSKAVVQFIELAKRAFGRASELRKSRGDKDPEVRQYVAEYMNWLQTALGHDPNNDAVVFQIGALLNSLEGINVASECAAAYFTRAIELSPWGGDKGLYYLAFGTALAKQGKDRDARIAWNEGIAKYPKEAGAIWEELASLDRKENQPFQAAYHAAVAFRLGGSNEHVNTARRIYDDNRKLLDDTERGRLDNAERKINEELGTNHAVAERQRKSGEKFVNRDCAALIERLSTLTNLENPGVIRVDLEPDEPDKPVVVSARPQLTTPRKDLPPEQTFDGAVALHKGGAYDLAVDEWEGFLQRFPDHPLAAQAQFFAGVCYLSLKDKQFDKARDAFEKVVAKYPKFDQIDKAYFNLGLADYNLAQAGRTDLHPKAAEAFGQLVAKFPNSPQVPEALLYRGESLYASGKKDEALRSWTELATKHAGSPARARGLYNLGIAEQELGQQAAAGETFDIFLKDYSKDELVSEVRMRKGDALLETSRFAEAEKQFAVALKRQDFPLADYATLRLGAALAGEKKYTDAAATYASLPGRFPKSSYCNAATLAAGNCFYLAGNQLEARTWLGKVLSGGGDQAAEAAHWIARSWLKEKQPAEALAAVEKALPLAEKSPRRGDLLMDKADALYDIPARRGEAATLYATLAGKTGNPQQSAQALYMAASAALGAGDYSGAIRHAEAFGKRFPNNALEPEVRFIAAESHLLSGNHAEADKRYQELLERFPNHADAEQWLVRRALARYLQKKYSDVVSYLKPQSTKLKAPERQAEAQFLLGSSELELKQYGDAAQALKASLAAQPKGPQTDETLLALAISQRGANDPAAARATLERLLNELANSKVADRAHFRSAEWKFESGDFAGAAGDYQWVVDRAGSSPLVPTALVGLGWSQINKSDSAAGAKTFSTVIEKYAGQAAATRARYGRAAARQQLKEFAGAVEDAEAFLNADPKSSERSDALYVLGLAQEGLQRFAEAAKTFTNLLAGDPNYSGADKALYELAWSRKSSNQEDGAADAFGKLAREHGDSPLAAESWFNVGEYQYHQKKDFKAAATAYYSAVTKAGKGELAEKADHKLGWAYFQAQDYPRARQAFESELASYPTGALAADAAFMVGESLFKQEQYQPALAAFQRALEMKPSSADFSALTLLHAGQAAGQVKRWDESLKHLERLRNDFPDSPRLVEATYEEGWAKQNLNQLDDALKLYAAVTEKTDGVVGARARFMMGEVLFTQGNHKEAIRNYFKVIYGYGDTRAAPPYKTWQANATYEAARCFDVLKSAEQAKKLYIELLTKYPESDKAASAKDRLKQLGS